MLTFSEQLREGELTEFAINLRDCDRKEIMRATGEDPKAVLRESWSLTESPLLFKWHGEPCAMLGASALTQTIGAPWMLATPLVYRMGARAMLELGHEIVETWLLKFHMLTNYVDADNAAARRFLKHLGFTEKETIPFGFSQTPFIRFEKIKCVNQQ